MLYQPSVRRVLKLDMQFRKDHPGSPFYVGDVLYEDHSVFTSFAVDDARPYDLYWLKEVFSDCRGYWGYFTHAEIKRMKIEEAHT